jgi:hypothetical protein
VTADPADCSLQFNPANSPSVKFQKSCDLIKALLNKSSVNAVNVDAPAGTVASVKIGETDVPSYDGAANGKAIADAKAALETAKAGTDQAATDAAQAALDAANGVKAAFEKSVGDALTAAGYPSSAMKKVQMVDGTWVDLAKDEVPAEGVVVKSVPANATVAVAAHFFDIFTGQKLMVIAILTFLIVLVTMVYGPIAALLVELFPTRIRYSGMSLPYHVGNGWFGGLLPATALAISAQSGNIYTGLWYAIVVALMTVVIGAIFVPGGTHKKDIFADDAK